MLRFAQNFDLGDSVKFASTLDSSRKLRKRIRTETSGDDANSSRSGSACGEPSSPDSTTRLSATQRGVTTDAPTATTTKTDQSPFTSTTAEVTSKKVEMENVWAVAEDVVESGKPAEKATRKSAAARVEKTIEKVATTRKTAPKEEMKKAVDTVKIKKTAPKVQVLSRRRRSMKEPVVEAEPVVTKRRAPEKMEKPVVEVEIKKATVAAVEMKKAMEPVVTTSAVEKVEKKKAAESVEMTTATEMVDTKKAVEAVAIKPTVEAEPLALLGDDDYITVDFSADSVGDGVEDMRVEPPQPPPLCSVAVPSVESTAAFQYEENAVAKRQKSSAEEEKHSRTKKSRHVKRKSKPAVDQAALDKLYAERRKAEELDAARLSAMTSSVTLISSTSLGLVNPLPGVSLVSAVAPRERLPTAPSTPNVAIVDDTPVPSCAESEQREEIPSLEQIPSEEIPEGTQPMASSAPMIDNDIPLTIVQSDTAAAEDIVEAQSEAPKTDSADISVPKSNDPVNGHDTRDTECGGDASTPDVSSPRQAGDAKLPPSPPTAAGPHTDTDSELAQSPTSWSTAQLLEHARQWGMSIAMLKLFEKEAFDGPAVCCMTVEISLSLVSTLGIQPQEAMELNTYANYVQRRYLRHFVNEELPNVWPC